MAIHPDVQRKVQKELDEVVGHGRIPSAEDCDKLEYLEASWKESVRILPPAPIGKTSPVLTIEEKPLANLLTLNRITARD